jgi:hypothetical protein
LMMIALYVFFISILFSYFSSVKCYEAPTLLTLEFPGHDADTCWITLCYVIFSNYYRSCLILVYMSVSVFHRVNVYVCLSFVSFTLFDLWFDLLLRWIWHDYYKIL